MTARIDAILTELTAVRSEFLDAVDSILGAAERIEDITPSLPLDAAAEISASTAEIFQSCGFQDITGQRLEKIMTLVKELVGSGNGDNARPGNAAQVGCIEPDGAARSLLNGPQAPGNALEQDTVDDLFDSTPST
jgi:chemotaxis protein CheZ